VPAAGTARLTRSAGRVAFGSGLVAITCRPRLIPFNCKSFINRSTVYRATGMPSRFSASHTFRGP
jgi:hypothetical protein